MWWIFFAICPLQIARIFASVKHDVKIQTIVPKMLTPLK